MCQYVSKIRQSAAELLMTEPIIFGPFFHKAISSGLCLGVRGPNCTRFNWDTGLPKPLNKFTWIYDTLFPFEIRTP